jgi:hypothetical protein
VSSHIDAANGRLLTINRAAKTTLVVLSVLLALIFGIGALSHSANRQVSVGGRIGGGIAALAFGFLAVRLVRLGVQVRPGGVVIRKLASTRAVDWNRVDHLRVVDSKNHGASCVAFVLTSGETVRATPTASYRYAKVQAALATLHHQRAVHRSR